MAAIHDAFSALRGIRQYQALIALDPLGSQKKKLLRIENAPHRVTGVNRRRSAPRICRGLCGCADP